MRQGRLIATGAMLAFCLFALWQSLLLSLTDRLGPGPGFFPFWLALIGAIVAEFFGSPTVGLGFRISTEAARMNMGLVWGAIVVAAVTGSVAYALLVAWAIGAGRLPLEAMFVPLALSALTFVAYALDKHAAQTGRWRTPESTLHLLELAGGWPGAWIAQQVLRHKSSKRAYRVVFRAMGVLHVIAVAAWLWGRA